jgi:hypothetical protein
MSLPGYHVSESRPVGAAKLFVAGKTTDADGAPSSNIPHSLGSEKCVVSLRRCGRFERVSVSNSLSGRQRELDQVPAVGDPAHIVRLGTGDRVSAGER